MKYINLGCGSKYSLSDEWINIDFNPKEKEVKKVNILKGLPFEDNTINAVYSSCMLEHFTKEQAERHIRECKRVLCDGGIIRIVVPDLENICKEYISILEKVRFDKGYQEKYEYIIIELIDQMTRSQSGGQMLKYWNKSGADLDYVRERTGFPEEWEKYYDSKRWKIGNRLFDIKKKIIQKSRLLQIIDSGRFAMQGELHKWMYDSYNLTQLLEKQGFSDIKVQKYNQSDIQDWEKYKLEIDSKGKEYKPNCLYIEAKA